jgi:hypothetical protein
MTFMDIRGTRTKKLVLAFLSFSLVPGFFCGCAPPSVNMVRDISSSKQYIFDAEENYQTVYNKILNQAKICLETKKYTARMMAQGEIHPEVQSGTITLLFDGILAVDTYQVIDMYALNDNSTIVIAYYSLGSVDKNGKMLKEWVLDNSVECEPKNKPQETGQPPAGTGGS